MLSPEMLSCRQMTMASPVALSATCTAFAWPSSVSSSAAPLQPLLAPKPVRPDAVKTVLQLQPGHDRIAVGSDRDVRRACERCIARFDERRHAPAPVWRVASRPHIRPRVAVALIPDGESASDGIQRDLWIGGGQFGAFQERGVVRIPVRTRRAPVGCNAVESTASAVVVLRPNDDCIPACG